MTENRELFTLAVDWSEGRTASYQSWRRWMTTEENARRIFERSFVCGRRCALVSADGRVLATYDDSADWR